jgi:protein-L-isoaspartate(D-aspartate) O-methyltransferase
MKPESLSSRKKQFIEKLKAKGIKENVIAAFNAVDISKYYDSVFADKFYTDETVSIGYGEKNDAISLLAEMINCLDLKRSMRVLEVGTGSGFSTSVISLLCKEVLSIEINEPLAKKAKNLLYGLGYENIRFFAGDATDSDLEFPKVDAIIVHAACKKRPLLLVEYLNKAGLMVYAMGPEHSQQIVMLENTSELEKGSTYMMKYFSTGKFSPIKGRYGYDVPEFIFDFEEIDEDAPQKRASKDLDANTTPW